MQSSLRIYNILENPKLWNQSNALSLLEGKNKEEMEENTSQLKGLKGFKFMRTTTEVEWLLQEHAGK